MFNPQVPAFLGLVITRMTTKALTQAELDDYASQRDEVNPPPPPRLPPHIPVSLPPTLCDRHLIRGAGLGIEQGVGWGLGTGLGWRCLRTEPAPSPTHPLPSQAVEHTPHTSKPPRQQHPQSHDTYAPFHPGSSLGLVRQYRYLPLPVTGARPACVWNAMATSWFLTNARSK